MKKAYSFLFKNLASTSLLMLIVMMCCSVGIVNAQSDEQKVSITVSKKKLARNENIEVVLTTSEVVDSYAGPEFKDFIIIAGPSKMTSMQATVINGRRSMERRTTFAYLIQPKREGNLTIEPAMISSSGKKHTTKPIKIEVTPAIANTPQLASTTSRKNPRASATSDNMHLLCVVSNHNPYIGEPFTVTYKLYYRVNINQPQVVEFPKFDGFWTQNFSSDDITGAPTQDYYKEELYQVAIWHKVLLIPQKAGKFTIPTMGIKTIAQIPTGKIDYWGDEMTDVVPLGVSSIPQSITIRELPNSGKPVDFTGAVGQFTMSSELSKSELQTGESSTLNVAVKGSGNINHLRLPSLTFPQEIESYDPKTQTKSNLTPTGLEGTVSEEFILIPRIKGAYQMPEIRFSYFDPQQNRYITLSAPEMSLKVEGDALPQGNISSARVEAEKSKVDYISNEIGFIRSKTKLNSKDKDAFYDSNLFSLLVFLPLMMIPLILTKKIFDRNSNRNSPEARAKRALAMAQKRLAKASKILQIGDYQAFYAELEASLYGFVQSKLGIYAKESSMDNIYNKFVELGADPTQVQALIIVIENCNMARYGGFSSAEAQRDYSDALSVIQAINKSI